VNEALNLEAAEMDCSANCGIVGQGKSSVSGPEIDVTVSRRLTSLTPEHFLCRDGTLTPKNPIRD
jgi:hypothetical protein